MNPPDNLLGADQAARHRIEWRVQRVAWVLLAVFITAAGLGFFGGGPFCRATTPSQGTLAGVEYERFWRNHSPMNLRIRVFPAAAADGSIRLWLDRAYLEAFEIESISPQPERVEVAADRLTYRFAAGTPATGAVIVFGLRPARPGSLHGEAGLPGGPSARFRHFIYP